MKKLEDMRVVELRAELEKRNLDKNGVKVVLIERLRKALEESGESQTSEEMADANNSEGERHASNDDAAAEQNGNSRQDFDENSCNDGESKDAPYLSKSGDMRVTDQVDEQDDDEEQQLQRPRRDDEEHDLAKRPSDESYAQEDREHSWSRDGGEDQHDYRREHLDEDDDSRFNDGEDSRYADDCSHFTDEHSRFTDEHSRFNDEDSRLSGDARAEDSQARNDEVEQREGNQEEPRYSEAENSAEATEFSKRSDEAAPASAGNFEDEINFMLDEDDNMLEEEMIYEDGTTNRGGQVDANTVDGKDSSTGQHSNKKTCGGTSNKSSGEKDASDGTTEGRQAGDSATADAESTTADGANEDSSTKDTNNMENSEKKSDAESASREDGVDDPKSTSSGRNLWVSGLSSSTRAQEIKSHFSKYGKVISAKIVMSAKSPASKCYGFITMSSTDEASACIKNLNKTELRGRIIQVERAKDDPSANVRRSLGHGEREPHGMQHSGSHDPRRRSEHPEDLRSSREHSRDRHGRPRVVDHRYGAPRPIRALGPRLGHNMPFREDGPRGNLSRRLSSRLSPSALRKLSPRHMEKQPLGISQIVEERERQRVRVRERLIREDERRAREDENRQRMIERRQREEAERLQREREALRAERERIERQKQELLRIEREQQRLEREKLEREREELRRQQMKLAHGPDRMDMKGVIPRFDDPRGGRSLKRPADDRGNRGDHYDDRKRAALDRMGGDSRQRYVPPAPPVHSRRYESGGRSDNHRYDNSYGGREGGSSGGRFDRSGGPIGGGPSGKPSHPQGDHIRWMPGGPGGAPGASNGRRSDGYYEDRRGDGRNSGSSGSESRSSRNYHVSYIAPPPAPTISRGGESGSRMSRDSGGKASYGGGSDVWRTGSSKSSGYGGGSSSSSSKNAYGSGSSSSKGAYGGPSDSASSGGLLPAPHDSSTWRGSVSSSSSSSRWPSDSRGGGSSGGGGGSSSGVGGNSGGSSSVPSYGGSGLPSSITSHHASSVASVPSQDTRGSYGVPAAPYRKY